MGVLSQNTKKKKFIVLIMLIAFGSGLTAKGHPLISKESRESAEGAEPKLSSLLRGIGPDSLHRFYDCCSVKPGIQELEPFREMCELFNPRKVADSDLLLEFEKRFTAVIEVVRRDINNNFIGILKPGLEFIECFEMATDKRY